VTYHREDDSKMTRILLYHSLKQDKQKKTRDTKTYLQQQVRKRF